MNKIRNHGVGADKTSMVHMNEEARNFAAHIPTPIELIESAGL
jgi:hypothetical protein